MVRPGVKHGPARDHHIGVILEKAVQCLAPAAEEPLEEDIIDARTEELGIQGDGHRREDLPPPARLPEKQVLGPQLQGIALDALLQAAVSRTREPTFTPRARISGDPH
jgi:hypothetical protein